MFGTVCPACEGRGSQSYTQHHAYGDAMEPEYMDEPCSLCDGSGYESTTRPVCLACGHDVHAGQRMTITHNILIHEHCDEETLLLSVPALRGA